jgi:sucrose-6-phosphate hydrolase SacC (GH32 family)
VKKKILLMIVVIFISIGLLRISKVAQEKYINTDNASTEQKELVKKTTEVVPKETAVVEGTVGTPKTKVESTTVTDKETVIDVKKESKTTVTKTPAQKSTTPIKEAPKAPIAKAPEAKKESNFIVKDDITGKVILSIYVNAESKTVAQVTFSELDNNGISYKATGRSEVVYFTMIANLKARDAGALSGWCFYVNGAKSSVSCGAYKLSPGDVVEWKYLKDGVNN